MSVIILTPTDAERHIIADVCIRRGYNVQTCLSLDDVLAKVQMVRPSILILDAVADGNGGRSILARLRGNEHTTRLPVILLFSGNWEIEPFVGSIDLTRVGLLTRPFATGELDAFLDRIEIRVRP